MVVGETARAENYSLGGYSKNDTNSLPCMFSFSKRSEYSSSEYQQNVLDVLSEGGGGHIVV